MTRIARRRAARSWPATVFSAATMLSMAGLGITGMADPVQAADEINDRLDIPVTHRRGTGDRPTPSRPPATIPQSVFGDHLRRALSLDAEYLALQAQVQAVDARHATVNTPIAGPPSMGAGGRMDTRGVKKVWQTDVEFGAPIWLPGQRGALGQQVDAQVLQAQRRATERALQLAGELREAWWNAVQAIRDVDVAQQRLETARAIQKDVERRAQFGDLSAQDALLGRNETLAAELDLSKARMDADNLRLAYSTLTGGEEPAMAAEPLSSRRGIEDHPMVQLALAGVEAARAQVRYVDATPRENPEVSLYSSQQGGAMSEEGTSFGFRLRLPLATEARNAPRRAEAQAALTRATVELAQQRRVITGNIRRAETVLERAKQSAVLAEQRLDVAKKQLTGARLAFEAGETGLFDLYRVRQLQADALAAEARAGVELNRARSRENQAMGHLPGMVDAAVAPPQNTQSRP